MTMERNYALEYRVERQRWDQVRENVREMEERAAEQLAKREPPDE